MGEGGQFSRALQLNSPFPKENYEIKLFNTYIFHKLLSSE
jgi:hypothetical protein